MAPYTLEGTWEEIAQQADKLAGKRVRVEVLPEENGLNGQADAVPADPRGIYYGMFRGRGQSTEEDFKIAEFQGDPDDGLEWARFTS